MPKIEIRPFDGTPLDWHSFHDTLAFASEYYCLKQGSKINNNSKLLSLNPFLDNDGLIRVGGRIQNSECGHDKRHPIIIPSHHRISELIATKIHIEQLHCGPTMLLSALRNQFWSIAGRNLARKIVRQCVTCFRTKPKAVTRPMPRLVLV